jgi:hypothetical protein
MRNIFIVLAAFLLLSIACRKTGDTIVPDNTAVASDSSLGIVVADTIIYDMIIRNDNPEDTWGAYCLQGLNHGMLIDQIFQMVYAGNAVAYNHETSEKLTPAQVKNIESEDGFNRSDIGKIQFTEVWYMNPKETDMTKKVIRMALGMASYDTKGELMGYKALFRVEM